MPASNFFEDDAEECPNCKRGVRLDRYIMYSVLGLVLFVGISHLLTNCILEEGEKIVATGPSTSSTRPDQGHGGFDPFRIAYGEELKIVSGSDGLLECSRHIPHPN